MPRPGPVTVNASRLPLRIELANEDDSVLAVPVVVGEGREPEQVLGPRPVDEPEPERLVEADRHAVAGPGDRLDASHATARDVVEERVSVAGARTSYGVVLDGDNVVDTEATAALREEMRSSR